jgi:hypothetical protein
VTFEAFGVDPNAAAWVCAACGISSAVAEAIVHKRAPGRVARCRRCSELQLVLVTIRDDTCADLSGFEMEI